MPETQTRREREDEIIDKVLKGVAAQSLTKLDCILYLGMFVSCVVDAHKREDAIRKSLENGVRYDGVSPLTCREMLEKLDAEKT